MSETPDLSAEEFNPPGLRGGPWSFESELMVLCARTRIDPGTAARINEVLARGIDWDVLIERSRQQGVLPLVCRAITTHFAESVPRDALEALTNTQSALARLNLLLTRELLRVLTVFESNGIVALPLKGPVLATRAYDSFALRQFADLDILVQGGQVQRARRLLSEVGFSETWPVRRFKSLTDLFTRRKDSAFVSANGIVRIELHWKFSGSHFQFPIDAEALLPTLPRVDIGGVSVRTLPPVELLLFLSVHGSRHGWERLGWVCDLAELTLRTEQLDWDLLTRRAREMGCERSLRLGMFLAEHVLGLALPPRLSREINGDPVVASLAQQISSAMMGGSGPHRGLSFWLKYHTAVKERWRDRVRLRIYYLARYAVLLFTPKENDQIAFNLPPKLHFLYYPLRAGRLAFVYGVRPVLGFLKGNGTH